MDATGEPPSGRCTSRWGGHLWYGHGGYTTASGDRRAMQRCAICGRTRLSPQTPSTNTAGPKPGASSAVRDAYAVFWDTVVRRYPTVGLPRAAKEATKKAGVSAATRARWLRRPRADLMPALDTVPAAQLRLLEAALYASSGKTPWPSTLGVKFWRRVRSDIWFEYDEPRHWGNDCFDSPGTARAIWQVVVRAACVAAVVRGEGIRTEVRDLVPTVSDGWLNVLLAGGLGRENARGVKSPISFWLDLRAGVAAIAVTRHRTVGLAGALLGDWGPGMRFRLQLERAEFFRGETLVIPVPSADRYVAGELRDYPVELKLVVPDVSGSMHAPTRWWNLDEGAMAWSGLIPKLFRNAKSPDNEASV